MSTVPKTLLSPQEYLVRERAAEFRSEFYRGEMFAMSGANARHNLICSAFVALAYPQVRPQGCKVFGSDMRVKVTATGLYTYPDATIACGPQYEDESEDVLLNPCVIVEVLSKSTERRDRGWKFDHYCELESLTDYVLIAQDKPLVEHFTREADGDWHLARPKGLAGVLVLRAVSCSLRLQDLYQDIELGLEDIPFPG